MSDAADDARFALLERIAQDTREALVDIRTDMRAVRADISGLRTELRGDIAQLDARLRGVEVSNGRIDGKLDALIDTIVGQTSAALAKLPSWWQMPAAIGATVALLMALFAGYRYLQTHGLM